MTYGKPTETFTREALGGCDHIRHLRVSHQTWRLLHPMRLAGTRNHCYSCNWRRDCLQDLEAQARLQLVKEGVHD